MRRGRAEFAWVFSTVTQIARLGLHVAFGCPQSARVEPAVRFLRGGAVYAAAGSRDMVSSEPSESSYSIDIR